MGTFLVVVLCGLILAESILAQIEGRKHGRKRKRRH